MPFWKSAPESRARKRFKEVFRDLEGAKYDVKVSLVHAAWDDSEIRASFAQFLEDPDSDVRYKACLVAGVISEEDPEAIRPFAAKLIILLEDKSSGWVGIHSCAEEALLNIGQKDPEILDAATSRLVKRLADRDEWEWDRDMPGFEAASGLASIADMAPEVMRPFIPQLLDLLKHPEDYIRSSTAFAVGMIGKKQPELVQPCLTELINLLGDRSKHARFGAARGIGFIGQADAALVGGAIPKLIDLLRDSDNRVRLASVAAIGQIADTAPKAVASATPALLKLVKDYDPDVKEVAEEVLQKISESP